MEPSAEGDTPEMADVWSFVIETRIFIEFNSEQTTVEQRLLKTKDTDNECSLVRHMLDRRLQYIDPARLCTDPER